MDRGDGARLRQAQQIAVAAEVARVIAEPVAPKFRLAEAVLLEHRAHGPVDDEDPLAQQGRQAGNARRSRHRRRIGRLDCQHGGH